MKLTTYCDNDNRDFDRFCQSTNSKRIITLDKKRCYRESVSCLDFGILQSFVPIAVNGGMVQSNPIVSKMYGSKKFVTNVLKAAFMMTIVCAISSTKIP